MSKLDELIKEFCPSGVEYQKIGNAVEYEQPTKYIVTSTDYNDCEGTPVLTAGQTFILGYTNEKDGIYAASKEKPVIIFDDFTGAFKWVDFPFKVKSSAMKMLTAKKDVAILRYIYHCMGHLDFSSSEHKRLWIGIYSEFQIPVPPIPVQEEIVRILDSFTELTVELTVELTARKKQYEYYRDKLLHSDTTIVYKRLGAFCDLLSGFPFDSSSFKETGIKLMRGMNIKRGYFDFSDDNNRYWQTAKSVEKYLLNDQDIVISMDGSLVGSSYGMVFKKDLPLLLVQRVTRIRTKQANARYVYHYIASGRFTEYVQKKKTAGAIPHISLKDISNFVVPLPPIEIQNRLVEVLDNFDSICSDLKIGLPAEIEARKKQYEFYRDKLLSF